MNFQRLLVACLGLSVFTASSHAGERIADVLADPALDLKRPEGRARAVARIKAIEEDRAVRARAKAKALGLQMRVEKPGGRVREIVDFEDDKPVYLITRNLNAGISTAANLVQVSPYSLDGTGVIAGVWDAGSVRSTHQEFANGGRVSIMDGAAADDHATHVGGTIGAQGTSANAKGMATNVSIHSYNWTSDQSEMTSRAATAPNQLDTKIYISNHSYGYADGWDDNEWLGTGTDQNAVEYSFGQYDSTARNLDSVMYGAPYYIAFWAAGNDGNDSPGTGSTVTIGGVSVAYNPAIHPPGDGVYRNGFETIGSHGNAKNLITIGAANDAVTSGTRDPSKSTLASFSSTGPTDDGRIKPDLVANGVSLTSTSSSGDTSYNSKSGTSMASPNATGSAALVVDQYKRLFNSAMRASTLKGLLTHTATDIGNPGPDYKYGWGLVDTRKAVDLLRDHHANPGKTRIIEDQVTTSATTRTYSFLWDGGSPLRATMCWTDSAGTSTTAHDSRTARLVNNLNLKLIAPNGTEYFPYVMPFVGTWTVASMGQNATTGINNTDNIETVNIQSPGQTGGWQAVVSYTGALANNSQAYGLVLSGTADAPNIVNLMSPNGGELFYHDVPYTISWVSNVPGNVSIELLKGGALHDVLSANEANDGTFSWTVPPSLPAAGDYAIRISSVSNPSYTDTSSAPFTIAVNPFAAALDTVGMGWSSGGTTPWFAQSTTTKDGVDAAQSGAIDHNGSSALEATITGPGTLTFWWKVYSETNYDFLRFYLNGIEQTGSLAKISGNVNWVQKTASIPAGTNTIQWTYSKDGSIVAGSDAAWVDQVVFTPDSAPEIAVEQPVGSDLTDGGAAVDFGSVNTGSSSSAFTFTIRNTGTASLTGLALSKTGTHSADYTLGSLGATSLAPGASTTFTATFTPGAAGTHTAAIQIASNDANENPFDINLAGNGVGPGTLAVTPAGGLTSSGSFGGAFTPSSQVFTLSNPGGTPVNWSAAKTQSWVDLSDTSGTLAAGTNTTVTVSINASANALNAGNHSDTVAFTNTTSGSGDTTRPVSLTVNPAVATIVLGDLNPVYDTFSKAVSVTTTPAGLSHSVTYNGSAALPTNAGTYAVVATITDPNFTGSNSESLVIGKAPQTISFGALAPVLDDAGSIVLGATASSSLAISYTSSNPLVATIAGSTVNIVGPGNTTITASQAGDTNYNAAASVPQTLAVVRANPLAVTGGPYSVLVGQSVTLDGDASEPSYNETINAYEWDLNNDNTFGDVTGASLVISYATLATTWGRVPGPNTIQLRVTDSSGKTSITSTTLTLVATLIWDANGTTANQTDGAGTWLNANQWWTGSANATWSSSANAILGNGGAGGAVTLASPTTVNTITFNSFTGTYTLGTAGNTVTLNGGITKNSGSGIVTITSPVIMGAAQTWTNHSSNALTTGNGTNLITNDGYDLTVDGTGTTSFGVISNAAVTLSGSGALIKNGSGRLNIGGVNDGFSGTVTINGGVMQVTNNNNPMGNGNLSMNGGVVSWYWGATYTRTLGTGNLQVQILGGESGFGGAGTSGPTVNLGTTVVWGALGQGSATGHFNPDKFVIGDPGTTNAGVITFSSGINMNGATRTIVVPKGLSTGGNVSTISAAISSTGTEGLIKEGNGTLILSAANTYTGDTTISGGILRIGNNTAGTLNSGNYAGNISVATGATLQIWSTAAQTLSGTISGAGGLNKAYGGSLTLSGPNTYTGRTSFLPQTTAGCTVNITSFNSVNGGNPPLPGSSLGAPTTIANGTIDIGDAGKQAGVNLAYTGPGETTDRVINFGFNGSASQTLTASGSGLLKFTSAMTSNTITSQSGALILAGDGSGEITQALPALPSGGLTKNGGGTWTLGGANSYTGPTTISSGRLALGANDVLPDASAVSIGNSTLDVVTFTDKAGTLDATGAAIINLGSGAVMAFDDSSAIDWTGGTLNITGTFISGASLRFGSGNTGLTSGQLAKISVNGGGLGTYTLDGGGFLTNLATVPNVVGLAQAVAGSNIIAAGLAVGTVASQHDLSVPAGSVISQSPAGGANVPRNSTVDLVVSLGPPTYTLSFDPNGGDTPSFLSKPVTYNSTYGELATTTRAGHTFNGWFTAAIGGTLVTSASTVDITADQTLYAQWSASTYTVTFDANGGDTPNLTNKPVTYDATYGELAITTRAGHTFNGWFTAATGGTLVTSASTVDITADQTLYAQWSASTYTVTFDANGGDTPSFLSKPVTYDSTYGELAITTRAGHTFNGWFTATTGGTLVTSASAVDITADQTLFAQWTASIYTVTFDANGGDTPSLASKPVTYDATYGELAITARTGHTFNGWYTAAIGGTLVTSASTVDITADQTLYAQWSASTYTVTFDANGGDPPSPTNKPVTYDSTYGELATTARTGHTFNGWFTAASGGTLVTSATTVDITADQTLFAQWTASTYTVTFDTNGGDPPSPTNKPVTYDSTYGELAITTRAGHTFNGWYTATTGGTLVTSATTVDITADQTLYAQWSASIYTVAFDANGGDTPSLANKPVTYDATYGELATTTRAGHTFNGWFTATTGGTLVTSASTVDITADQTLFAQWTASIYTVTFDANGGDTPSFLSKPVTYDSTYGELATTTRAGHTFNGWFTATTGGTLVTSASAVDITADQTLYAQWTASIYTVTFDANGGDTPSFLSKPVTYDSTYGELAITTRAGHTFNGWFTATTGGTLVTSASAVDITADQTLYAQWTASIYTVTFDANGGDTPSFLSKPVTYDSTYGELAITTRAGHTFNGWFTAASGGTLVTSASTVDITADQTLFAQWTASTYTVTFDANGGDPPSPTNKPVTYDSTYGELATTARTGHTFNGWFTAASGGTLVTSATTVDITADQTLFAQWTASTYTLHYIAGTGGSITGTTTQTVNHGTNGSQVTAVPASGYLFVKWSDDVMTASRTDTNLTADLTVTANFAMNAYTAWSGGAAFEADSNNDGLDNGMAWLLGAANPSENALDKLPVASRNGTFLRLTFRCLKSAMRGGTQLKIQSSADLGVTDPWTSHEAAVPDDDGTLNGVLFDTTDDGDFINVIADIPAADTRLFGRLTAASGP